MDTQQMEEGVLEEAELNVKYSYYPASRPYSHVQRVPGSGDFRIGTNPLHREDMFALLFANSLCFELL